MGKLPSRTLGPTSDLVVAAPWKPDIIYADEAILPQTRFNLTFKTLFQIRATAREAVELQAFADPIERLEKVHSFRVAATPEAMRLAVTYDFGWDPYMRALWDEGRPFLDLLCCNCAGYGLARDTPLREWAQWIRDREVTSDYFYAASQLTVADLQQLSQAERIQRDEVNRDMGDFKVAGSPSVAPGAMAVENQSQVPEAAQQQALGIIATMFRLTRYYGANIAGGNLAEDALTLLLATRGLLGDWDAASVKPLDRQRFARELAWFAQPIPGKPGSVAPQVPVAREKVQRGILTGFDTDTATISHGAMLFIKVSDPGLAAASLASLAASIATESLNVASDGIYRNLALTYAGLQNLGLKADLLKQFPEALREGAAARAGQVGDVRTFHPSHWTPLPRNWPAATAETASLSLVDAVIQLRVVSDSKVSDIYNAAHPLHAAIAAVAALPGLKLLSVETLTPAADQPRGFNSFGLRDGISQPTITERKADAWSDTVAAGDLLLGHLNAAQDIPIAGTGAADADLANGSYLAIRRMPMNPDNFDKLIEKAKALTGLDKDVIKGKIVGRAADGSALVPATGGNDFVYVNDRDGALCPRQSHARRVNPRENAHGRPPRIARRGMSFTARDGQGSMFMAYCANLGEQYEVVLRWLNGGNSTRIGSFLGDPLCGVPDKVRTRTYRFTHQGRVYRLQLPSEADAAVKLSWSLYLFAPSIDMIKALPKLVERPGYPKLDEGLLKLARKRIADLRSRNAREAEWRNILDEPGAQVSGLQAAVWQVIREEHGGLLRAHDSTPGIEVIDTLIDGQPGTQMYPDPIEVPPAPARDLWLVADHDKICTVLHDDGQKFSVKGAGERITESIKKFHLGLDAHTAEYKLESARCNAGLASVSATDAYDHAFARTSWLIDRIVAGRPAPVSIDLMKHLLEPAMALMAPDWFGIPDAGFGAVPGGEGHICMGSSDWRPVADRMPAFPGDFWNSSRYAFNPFISTETQRLSKEHGEAILAATEKYITNKGRRALEGTVVHSLLHRLNDAEPPAPSTDSDGYDGGVIQYPTDNDLARVLVGAMLGWIATTLGNAARLFDPLITSGNFQRLQDVWNDPQTPSKSYGAALAVFDAAIKRGMGMAPVPEWGWRLVGDKGATLGTQKMKAGAKIVLGFGSAAAQLATANTPVDNSYIYFGLDHRCTGPKATQTPHGCPGRDMALGVLTGVLAALAEKVVIQPGGGRLLVDLTPRA